MALSRPPIQTPLLRKDGRIVERPWMKFFQEAQEHVNNFPRFLEDTSANLKNYDYKLYPVGSEFYATDIGKFYVATSKGWVQR